jgi:hypothetical protein
MIRPTSLLRDVVLCRCFVVASSLLCRCFVVVLLLLCCCPVVTLMIVLRQIESIPLPLRPRGRPPKPPINGELPLFATSSMTLQHAIYVYLDIQLRHRLTQSTMHTIFKSVRTTLPTGNNLCTYAEAMRYINAQGMMVVYHISVCVNDCITYTDSPETKDEYAHLTRCPLPRCGESRNDNHGKPRKVRTRPAACISVITVLSLVSRPHIHVLCRCFDTFLSFHSCKHCTIVPTSPSILCVVHLWALQTSITAKDGCMTFKKATDGTV